MPSFTQQLQLERYVVVHEFYQFHFGLFDEIFPAAKEGRFDDVVFNFRKQFSFEKDVPGKRVREGIGEKIQKGVRGCVSIGMIAG